MVDDINFQIFVCIVCWGAWGIFDKKALQRAKELEVMFLLYFLSAFTIPPAILLLCTTLPGWHLAPTVIFWTGLASLTYTMAIQCYLSAMRMTEASYVLGITAAYPLVLQVLATIFLHEQLLPQRLLGALVIAAGTLLIGASGSDEAKSIHPLDQEAVMAIESKAKRYLVIVLSAVSMTTWAVYGLFDKIALSAGDPKEVFLSQRLWDLVMLVLFYFILRWRKIKLNLNRPHTWLYCSLSEGCLAVGAFFYLLALSKYSASYVLTITGAYPLLMYLFALLILKEKFNGTRLLGIFLIVGGAIAVQLTQGK